MLWSGRPGRLPNSLGEPEVGWWTGVWLQTRSFPNLSETSSHISGEKWSDISALSLALSGEAVASMGKAARKDFARKATSAVFWFYQTANYLTPHPHPGSASVALVLHFSVNLSLQKSWESQWVSQQTRRALAVENNTGALIRPVVRLEIASFGNQLTPQRKLS